MTDRIYKLCPALEHPMSPDYCEDRPHPECATCDEEATPAERASDGHWPDCSGWEDCECFPDRKDRKIEALRREVRSRGWTIVGAWCVVVAHAVLDGARGYGWTEALFALAVLLFAVAAYPVGDWATARARALLGIEERR